MLIRLHIYIPIWVDLKPECGYGSDPGWVYLHSNMGGFKTMFSYWICLSSLHLHSNMGGFKTAKLAPMATNLVKFTFQYGWI